MKRQPVFRSLVLLAALVALALTMLPAAAESGQPQIVVSTPTAGPDGRILYKVQPGDTCISISLIYKIPLDDLRRLNGLEGEECGLRVDQELLLGVVEASPAAPVATVTPTLMLGPAVEGKGQICIDLFDDLNGNGISEDGELLVAGGAASVVHRAGKASVTGDTRAGLEPLCFADLPVGEYTISLAVPDGYNPTTTMQYVLDLRNADQVILDFGAQISTAAQPVPVSEGGRSPLLGIIGGLLVLLGAGLGIYLAIVRR
jgi:hypothetical protein